MRFLLLIISFIGLLPADVRSQLEPLLERHCYDCHDDFDQEGDLNLLDLPFRPDEEENREIWEHVVRRVEAGEMPPKKKISKEERAELVGILEVPLIKAGRDQLTREGRVHTRRLTALEYEYAVQDLLGIRIPLASELTGDSSEGFSTNADSQQVSHFHLHNYLRVGDAALEEAFGRARKGDVSDRKSYPARDLTNHRGGNDRGPQFWEGRAISWYSPMQFAGRLVMTKVEENGWYRITIHDLDAVNPGPDGSTWGTLETGSGYSNEPLLYPIGLVEATETPTTLHYDGWMRKGHIILLKPDEAGLKRMPTKGGSFKFQKKDYAREGYTGFRFNQVTIERIYPGGSAEIVRDRLFGEVDPQNPGAEPAETLEQLIRRFARRAFRRPPTTAQLDPYKQLAVAELDAGKSFEAALRSAYHAILCSPRFLAFVEEPGPLDSHAIATRLSFLLWKTIPDEDLLALADEGRLRDPKVLLEQIGRLLDDPRSLRFIKDFTDQWLDLRSIDATQPDPRRFGRFDPPLQRSLKLETRAFLAGMIAGDFSVSHFLKSDSAYLNTRLRDHYGLEAVKVDPGRGIQKVKLGSEERSGLLTQASILKVTADGSVTSPVVRGVWINERILGRHIPPPPDNVPAIEPDIRGAVSIRDQLAKHTTSTSCAGCHKKIDPSGFALENFDPVGQWRRSYGNKKDSAKVDPSGITPDGLAFEGFEAWRRIYLKKPEMLTRSFATQLLEYGMGAGIRFSDRPQLDKIVTDAGHHHFGLRRIILASLSSDIFLNK